MSHWHPSFGDPTPIGWLTTIAYALAAIACLSAARRATQAAQSAFWLSSMAVLLCLGVNKQLDLQSLVIEQVRHAAISHGWFSFRRSIQLAAFLICLAGMVMVFAVLATRSRLSPRSIRAALTGFAMIAAFILFRLAHFSHTSPSSGGWNYMWFLANYLELIGLVVICGGAITFGAKHGD